MNIGSKFGKLRDVMNEVKTQSTQPKPAEASKAPQAAEPQTLAPKENLKTPPKLGSASTLLKHNPEAAIKAFQKAADGKQIPLGNSSSPNEALKSVLDFAKSKLGKSEMMNVFKFMGDIDRSDNASKLGKAIQENGLTTEQLDMIANGEFTSKDYVSMINKGESAG